MAVSLSTTQYRFGINELLEATHGWHANQNANPAQGVIVGAATFLLRIGVQESGGTIASNTDLIFECAKNGGAFQAITTSSTVVKAVNGVLTNGADTTQRLTGLTGTFEASSAGVTEDGSAGGNANDIPASGNCETECALQFVPADLATGDVVTFRLTSPDFTITNNVTPTITYDSGAQAITLTAAQGSYALTGQAVTFTRKYTLPAAQGSYALTGQGNYMLGSKEQGYLILENGDRFITEASDPFVTEGFVAPITAAFGTYTLTGQAATFIRKLTLTAAQGSYTLTGQAAATRYDRTMPAAQGSYALTGQAVAFKRTYTLPAAQGSYTLSGQTVAFKRTHTLTANHGSYILTGQAATLARGLRLTAAQGAYVLSGQAAALSKSAAAALAADVGIYSITGQSIEASRHQTMPAETGMYTVSGHGVELTYEEGAVVEPPVLSSGGAGTTRRRKREVEVDYLQQALREDEELLLLLATWVPTISSEARVRA